MDFRLSTFYLYANSVFCWGSFWTGSLQWRRGQRVNQLRLLDHRRCLIALTSKKGSCFLVLWGCVARSHGVSEELRFHNSTSQSDSWDVFGSRRQDWQNIPMTVFRHQVNEGNTMTRCWYIRICLPFALRLPSCHGANIDASCGRPRKSVLFVSTKSGTSSYTTFPPTREDATELSSKRPSSMWRRIWHLQVFPPLTIQSLVWVYTSNCCGWSMVVASVKRCFCRLCHVAKDIHIYLFF